MKQGKGVIFIPGVIKVLTPSLFLCDVIYECSLLNCRTPTARPALALSPGVTPRGNPSLPYLLCVIYDQPHSCSLLFYGCKKNYLNRFDSLFTAHIFFSVQIIKMIFASKRVGKPVSIALCLTLSYVSCVAPIILYNV